MNSNALTPAQTEALKQYIAEFNARKARNEAKPKRQRVSMSKDWKCELSVDWYFARRPGVLHALRNTHGPEWLDSFDASTLIS